MPLAGKAHEIFWCRKNRRGFAVFLPATWLIVGLFTGSWVMEITPWMSAVIGAMMGRVVYRISDGLSDSSAIAREPVQTPVIPLRPAYWANVLAEQKEKARLRSEISKLKLELAHQSTSLRTEASSRLCRIRILLRLPRPA